MKPTSIYQIQSGLTPYAGAWGKAEVLHLLRRTMFGTSVADLNYFKTRTLAQAVAELLTAPTTAPAPPLNDYNTQTALDPNVAAGATWVNAPANPTMNGGRQNSLRAWWTGLQLDENRSLNEKMTLFWHNHFATSLSVYKESLVGYQHTVLLRANALGNFKTLTRAITIDPAMLYYLNGYKNTKTAPDENYARELQELFTVGKDLPNHYTEDDVKAAAKVLTGWRINSTTLATYFDPTKHDSTNKTFSAFYGGTVITGSTAATAGDTELDALLSMIFAHNEVANYLCRKLYRFFVYYDITADAETNVIQPLAALLRQNNYNITPVLSALFNSQHFFDMMQVGCIIKSPIDFTVGFARTFGMQFPAATDYSTQYYMWKQVWFALYAQQQATGDLPSVAGWAAYYQLPAYHEVWITPDTLRSRKNISDGLLYTGITKSGFTLKVDVLAFTASLDNPADPNVLIDDALQLLTPMTLSATTKAYLKSILLSFQSADHYWTDAWNNYATTPTTTNINVVKPRLQYFYSYIMNLAEYHLS